MSVDSQYEPVYIPAKGMGSDEDRTYHFEMESIGDAAMQMYEVTTDGLYKLIEEWTDA